MNRENMNSCDYTADSDNTFTIHPINCQCATCASGTTHPAYHEVMMAATRLAFTQDTKIINRSDYGVLLVEDENGDHDYTDVYPDDEIHLVGPGDVADWIYRSLVSQASGNLGGPSTLLVSDSGNHATVQSPFRALVVKSLILNAEK